MCSGLRLTALRASWLQGLCRSVMEPCSRALGKSQLMACVAHQRTNGFQAGPEEKLLRAVSKAAAACRSGIHRTRRQVNGTGPSLPVPGCCLRAWGQRRLPSAARSGGGCSLCSRSGGWARQETRRGRLSPRARGGGRGRAGPGMRWEAAAAPARLLCPAPLATGAPAAPNQRAAVRAQPIGRRARGRGAPERGGPATRRAAILTSEEQKR